MQLSAPFLVQAPIERTTPWRVVVDGPRSNGMVLGDAVIPPRTAGPSRHTHTREDEAIYVIEGVLTAEVGAQRFEITRGDFLWMPRGLPHTFANLTHDPVSVIGLIHPSGFEQFFTDLADYLTTADGDPDQEVILEINQRYGVHPAEGPPLI